MFDEMYFVKERELKENGKDPCFDIAEKKKIVKYTTTKTKIVWPKTSFFRGSSLISKISFWGPHCPVDGAGNKFGPAVKSMQQNRFVVQAKPFKHNIFS